MRFNSKINILNIDSKDYLTELMKNKKERIELLKSKYSDGKIAYDEIEKAEALINEGAENYLDVELLSEENKQKAVYGLEDNVLVRGDCFEDETNEVIGLAVHDRDAFIYFSIETDMQNNIKSVTEKYLFSAEAINKAIEYTEGFEEYINKYINM